MSGERERGSERPGSNYWSQRSTGQWSSTSRHRRDCERPGERSASLDQSPPRCCTPWTWTPRTGSRRGPARRRAATPPPSGASSSKFDSDEESVTSLGILPSQATERASDRDDDGARAFLVCRCRSFERREEMPLQVASLSSAMECTVFSADSARSVFSRSWRYFNVFCLFVFTLRHCFCALFSISLGVKLSYFSQESDGTPDKCGICFRIMAFLAFIWIPQ